MKKNIPLDGTNANEAIADKDAMSLLIMRQAFLDATEDADENDRITDEVTDEYIDKYTDERG